MTKSVTDINFDDIVIDIGDTTNIYGAADSMYDTYYASSSDTITLTGLEDIFSTKPDLEVKGDIKVDGVSLKDWMSSVNDRLSILQPKPELLEKYTALQKAYDHYKTLETLLHNADKDTPPN